ncbi:MAG: hypothetical protein RL141_669 [Candidatus Parcubacteria bacterium]|jgi:glycosyltransferase involved in cell wall biosynthesis
MTLRILIFSTAYFPLVGGAEVAMKEITDRIQGVSFDLICAKIRPGLLDMEQIGNITVHRVGFGHWIDKFLLPVWGAWRAVQLVPASDIRVIWSLMASFGGFAALIYTWMRPKTKMLLTLQEGDPLEHYDRRAGVFGWLHRRIFQRADVVQAISHFLADWAVKMGFKGTPMVIPNGVDLQTFLLPVNAHDRIRLRTQFRFNPEDVVLVTASRLSYKNAVDDLIVALTHLPIEYKALILGGGEDEQALRALAYEKGVSSRVVFAGEVLRHHLLEYLQCADVFIRASRSEGLGIAFLEAMAAGLPTIGTRVGGIPDFLVDGETGVFCEPNDPASIAQAVLRIQNDAPLRARLVQNAPALIRDHFGWNSIAGQMRTILTQL